MNEEAVKLLEEIVKKEPAALTDADKEFLRARSKYLNREQKKQFAEALGEQTLEKEETEESKRSDWSKHPADQEDEGEDEA